MATPRHLGKLLRNGPGLVVAQPVDATRCRYFAVPAGPKPKETPLVITSVRPTQNCGDHTARWVKEHMASYFGRRKGFNYRSTDAWSLRELDDQFSIFKPNFVVLDLGCFPGGWSEVAVERAQVSSSSSVVVGVDKVKMQTLNYHTFVHGCITEDATSEKLSEILGERRADVVLSDLNAPKIGLKFEDHMASMELCLQAAKVMESTLNLGGWFICKFTAGPTQAHWRTYLESKFSFVRSTRTSAARSQHREMFFVCRGFIGRGSIHTETPRPELDAYRYEGTQNHWQVDLKQQRRGEVK